MASMNKSSSPSTATNADVDANTSIHTSNHTHTDSDIEEEQQSITISLPDVDESDYDDLLDADFNEKEEDFLDEELSYEEEGRGGGGTINNYNSNGIARYAQNSQSENANNTTNTTSSTVMDGRMSPKKKNQNKVSPGANLNLDGDYCHDNNNDNNGIILSESDYILGTLIVRVVAAKDLKAAKQNARVGAGAAIVGSLRDAIFKSDTANKKKQPGTRINSSNSTMAMSNPNNQQYQHQSHYEEDRRRNRRGMGANGRRTNSNYNNSNSSNGTANPYATITFANQTEISSTVYDTLHPSFPRNEQAYLDVSLPVPHLAHEGKHEHEHENEHENDFEKKRGRSKLSSEMKINMDNCKSNSIPIPSPPQRPILTVVIKHDDREEEDDAEGESPMKKSNLASTSTSTPSKDKSHQSTYIDDQSFFLGTASIDVTQLITGKITYIDKWLALRPSPNSPNSHGHGDTHATTIKKDKRNPKNDNHHENSIITGQVRIICEYEICDSTPRPGDLVRLNGFVDPMDVYPIPVTQIFRVDDIGIGRLNNNINNINNTESNYNNDDDENLLVLSYRSKPEDWYCTFVAHRYMFISVERHTTAIERYQDELVDILSNIVSSPAAHVVQKTVSRLPEEGILYMGLEAGVAGFGLAGRWLKGGVGTIVDDIVYATNLDGKSGTITGNGNGNGSVDSDGGDEEQDNEDNLSITSYGLDLEDTIDADDDLSLDLGDDSSSTGASGELQPSTKPQQSAPAPASATPSLSMPCCPISGQPMKQPVVAADGHTYEKKAIARWFRKSNISPLTGQELPHKELVPNYLLISTFQIGPAVNVNGNDNVSGDTVQK